MKVLVAGTGPVGRGYAAYLDQRGHEAQLFSPRGRVSGPLRIDTFGYIEADVTLPVVDAPAAAGADAVVIAVLGNGLRATIDALVPHLHDGQAVVVSSHSSFAALYLSRRLAERGVRPLIVAWATTVTGGPMVDGRVHVRLLRGEIDAATIPAERVDEGVALSAALFGDRFAPSLNLLAISLSNLNPPIHLANTLLNFTRVENGERWENFGGISPAVGRVIEALDRERLALAEALGVRVRTVFEHYRKSFSDMPDEDNVHALAQKVETQRKGSSPGPTSVNTRFITEDVPFGIQFIVALARVCGIAVPVHQAGLVWAGAAYNYDFADDNDLLPALGLEALSLDTLRAYATEGWPNA